MYNTILFDILKIFTYICVRVCMLYVVCLILFCFIVPPTRQCVLIILVAS